MADRRICVDILQVGLDTGGKRSVDHADTRENHEYPAELHGCMRHQIDGDAEAAVASKLHQHAGVEH